MAQRLPALTARQVASALERAGFFDHHQTGSHRVYKHPQMESRRIVVPMHSGDLKRGLVFKIIRDSGMTVEEFRRFL